ncbi:unnamed protein product, partial [Polarella glacialis]
MVFASALPSGQQQHQTQQQQQQPLQQQQTEQQQQLDSVAVNSAVHACATASAWHHALGLLRQAQNAGNNNNINNKSNNNNSNNIDNGKSELPRPVVNLVTYNSAIRACGRGLMWDRALGLLAEVWERGLQPDATSANSALTSCEVASLWEAAAQLMAALPQKQLEPDSLSFAALIAACAAGRSWQAAIFCLTEAEGLRSAGPAAFAAGMAGERHWSSALRVLALATSRSMKLDMKEDLHLHGAAMESFRQSAGKTWPLCVQLLARLRLRGAEPDALALEGCLRACGRQSAWRAAATTLADAESWGLLAREDSSPLLFSAAAWVAQVSGHPQLAQ